MQARGDLLVFEREDCLDQTGDTGSFIQVAEVCLDRADGAKPLVLSPGAKRPRQGLNFNRISQNRSGSMGLDVGYGFRFNPGHGLSFGNHLGLAVDARSGVADFRGAVVVDSRASDHRPDRVAICQRIPQPLQQDNTHAAPANRPLSPGIKGAAVAIGGTDAALFVEISLLLRNLDSHTAGERHVAVVIQQALARDVNSDQRRGAGGVHIDAGTLQVQLVGHSGGHDSPCCCPSVFENRRPIL